MLQQQYVKQRVSCPQESHSSNINGSLAVSLSCPDYKLIAVENLRKDQMLLHDIIQPLKVQPKLNIQKSTLVDCCGCYQQRSASNDCNAGNVSLILIQTTREPFSHFPL